MDRLKALEVFKSVTDHMSFSKAADALSMSRPIVSRMVQDLEDELGGRLLIRTTRKVSLTTFGQCVLDRANAVIDLYEELTTASKQNALDVSGTVQLEVTSIYGIHAVGPTLAAFMHLHPKVNVDLRMLDPSACALSDQGDVSIAVGTEVHDSHIARPLSALKMGLFASRRYWKGIGAPEHPSALSLGHCMSLSGREQFRTWDLVERLTDEAFTVSGLRGLSANNVDALIEAAVHDSGVILVPQAAAEGALASRDLIPVLADWKARDLEVHLVYRSRRREPARVRRLIEHLMVGLCETFDESNHPGFCRDHMSVIGREQQLAVA